MAPTTRSLKRRADDALLVTPETTQTATATKEDELTVQSGDERSDAPVSDTKTETRSARKRPRRTQKEESNSAVIRSSKQVKIKGKLEVFKNLPVEVFIGIAKYLHPFDLVLLSRVNKFFRELFMSRQAASIWVSARLNVPDLPPCPPELCEPQYAALLFTKICSHCGKYAPRHMDPILLVRLCSSCREDEFKCMRSTYEKVPDLNLIPRSSECVPRSFRRYGLLCLSSDADAIESKIKELMATGDKEALSRWKEERKNAVENRYINADLFRKWFAARDRDRESELNQLKDAHEAEVESRLISLGWEKVDHLPQDRRRGKRWLSLVRSSKSLTDRAWEKLLPLLTEHLEINKKERLVRERCNRRTERSLQVIDFWNSTKEQLPCLIEMIQEQVDTENVSPTDTSKSAIRRSFPPLFEVQRLPECQKLMEEDITGSEMKLKLLEKQDVFTEFADKWATRLEEMLIQHLPDHVEPPDFNMQGSSLRPRIQPADTLFAGVQMLLRADVIFKRNGYSSRSFYPEDFSDTPRPDILSYDTEASSMATELLRALGKPGATYLEIKSMGTVFKCGRCHDHGGPLNWKTIVRGYTFSWAVRIYESIFQIYHYIEQKSEWLRRTQSQSVRLAEDFVYLFSHDTKVENSKPLVRVVKKNDYTPYYLYHDGVSCLVCSKVGIHHKFPESFIGDHLYDVHLIEEPEKGKHFQ
ncbi:A Receptor for Ubiquitination Targets, partial [Rhizoctonia solani]